MSSLIYDVRSKTSRTLHNIYVPVETTGKVLIEITTIFSIFILLTIDIRFSFFLSHLEFKFISYNNKFNQYLLKMFKNAT